MSDSIPQVPEPGPKGSASKGQGRIVPATRWALFSAVGIITLLADQVSKAWALRSLQIGSPHHVLSTLRFNLAFNTGMAFSRGVSSGPLIGVIAIAIAAAMVFFARQSSSKVQLVAMGAIIGGALGNVFDRLLRVGALGSPVGGGFMSGSVVDFIDVQFWPIFNLADAAVVVGGIVLAVHMLWFADETEPEDPDPHDDSSRVAPAAVPVSSDDGPQETDAAGLGSGGADGGDAGSLG